jgi:hypothetical protein
LHRYTTACKASVGEIELDVGNYKNLFYGARGGSYVSAAVGLYTLRMQLT